MRKRLILLIPLFILVGCGSARRVEQPKQTVEQRQWVHDHGGFDPFYVPAEHSRCRPSKKPKNWK